MGSSGRRLSPHGSQWRSSRKSWERHDHRALCRVAVDQEQLQQQREPACIEVALSWHKSSHSSNESAECVEIAASPGTVHVRDSKDPEGRSRVRARRMGGLPRLRGGCRPPDAPPVAARAPGAPPVGAARLGPSRSFREHDPWDDRCSRRQSVPTSTAEGARSHSRHILNSRESPASRRCSRTMSWLVVRIHMYIPGCKPATETPLEALSVLSASAGPRHGIPVDARNDTIAPCSPTNSVGELATRSV